MALPVTTAALWRLNANRAEFRLESWTGSIDLAQPAHGVEVNEISTIRPSGAQVLGIEVGKPARVLAAAADAYIREADLVALYPETQDFAFGIQNYWTLATCDVAGKPALQIDLMISIQTQQLGVRARIAACSRLASSTAWQCARAGDPTTVGHAGFVAAGASRLAGDRHAPLILAELTRPTEHAPGGSYIEATLPSDFLGAELVAADGWLSIRRSLLDETMEKGVIRRLRCRGTFVREPVRPELASRLYQQFCREKPRLDT